MWVAAVDCSDALAATSATQIISFIVRDELRSYVWQRARDN